MNDFLKAFANNPEMFEVVKRTITDAFRNDEVNTASGASDELLGQITRARLDGLRKVESVFREMERYRDAPTGEPPANPAR